MKIKIIIITLLLSLVTILFSYNQIVNNYPESWKEIELGDSRTAALEQLGKPASSLNWDAKGEVWIYENKHARYEILLAYNLESDTSIIIKKIGMSLFSIQNYNCTIENNFKE